MIDNIEQRLDEICAWQTLRMIQDYIVEVVPYSDSLDVQVVEIDRLVYCPLLALVQIG